MKTSAALLLILSILIAAPGMGQDGNGPRKMNLREVIAYALENNPNLRNARIDRLIAKKTIWETTAIGLPQVNVQGLYTNIFKVPEANFGQTVLNIDIPDGTVITPQVLRENISLGFTEGQAIKLGVKENITADFSFSQLIFSGEYIVGLQAAKTFYQLSTQSLAKTEAEVKEAVTNAYYLVLILEENNQILTNTLKNIEQLYAETRAIEAQGFIEDTEADQLELTKNNVANSIETLRRQTELAYKVLKLQMGMPFDEELGLTEKIEELASFADTSWVSMDFSLEANPSFQLMKTQEKLADLNLKREYSKFLPTLAGNFNHQWRYDKPDFDFMSPNTLAISLSMPLFTSGSRLSTLSKRKLELEKARISRDFVGKGLVIEAQQAQTEYKSAFSRYKTEYKNVQLADRIFQKTSRKYKEGVSSGMELTQAQNQFLNSQSNYFQAISDLLSRRSKIARLFQVN